MNRKQRERFQKAGWKIGTVGEFFGLTPADQALIETKIRLGGIVRTLRQRSHLSQADLAKKIGSSQPRVAKLESSDPEVSLDLQMKAIFASRPGALAEFSALISKWGKWGSTASPPRQPGRIPASKTLVEVGRRGSKRIGRAKAA